jgi:hypothetical protein
LLSKDIRLLQQLAWRFKNSLNGARVLALGICPSVIAVKMSREAPSFAQPLMLRRSRKLLSAVAYFMVQVKFLQIRSVLPSSRCARKIRTSLGHVPGFQRIV